MPISIVLRNEIIKQIILEHMPYVRKESITMTETLKNLKNEPYESLRYTQLVSTLVANHQNIEKSRL